MQHESEIDAKTGGSRFFRADSPINQLDVAVLIPCYNEEKSIGFVVKDLRKVLPGAIVYVYDNNSSDRTVEEAREAGAVVGFETARGKGNVVRRMFGDVEADIYILIDGNGTYQASAAPRLLETLISNSLDMVCGSRVEAVKTAYPPGHRFGNRILSGLVGKIFGNRTKDMLSGYRVFSRRFVKSFPALSRGFEIETELTVHALELRMPIVDVDTEYGERPPGSESKLSTVKDGFRIMRMIMLLVKEERPMQFFGAFAVLLASVSLLLVYPVFAEYVETGLVPRLPTAVLSAAVMLMGLLSLFAGLILDTVTLGRREMKRLGYLRFESVGSALRTRNKTLT